VKEFFAAELACITNISLAQTVLAAKLLHLRLRREEEQKMEKRRKRKALRPRRVEESGAL